MTEIRRLFISYRSSDAVKVDKIVRDLALLKAADDTPLYLPWQDKHNLPPASPHWWDAIVDAIATSDAFVFHISHASLQSDVCRAELEYAHALNKPIIPVMLEGEFVLNPQSKKYDITYWHLVPDWLAERQFLFYLGAEFYDSFQEAVKVFERNPPTQIKNVPRPLNPDSKGEHRSNHARYSQACDYAARLAFTDAKKLFDALVRRKDRDYEDVAAEWLEILNLYEDLVEIVEQGSAAFVFKKKWAIYTALFPKEFIDGIFDPRDFGSHSNDKTVTTGEYRIIQNDSRPPESFSEALNWASLPEEGPTEIQRLTKLLDMTFTDPEKTEFYFQLGSAYYEMNDYEMAVKNFEEALRLALRLKLNDRRIKQWLGYARERRSQ